MTCHGQSARGVRFVRWLFARQRSVNGAGDLTIATVRGLHFGGPIAEGEAAGTELAAAEIIAWLAKRHELTPPA